MAQLNSSLPPCTQGAAKRLPHTSRRSGDSIATAPKRNVLLIASQKPDASYVAVYPCVNTGTTEIGVFAVGRLRDGGEVSREKATRWSQLPDLGCDLPGINGLDFQQRLRNAGFHIPIIFVTGYGTFRCQ